MTKKQLQEQLLALVEGNPDIPKKMQDEITKDIERFSEHSLVNMILYIMDYFKKVTHAYRKVDKELKGIVQRTERSVEQQARNAEKVLIENIEKGLKRVKDRL